ncbi:MAG: Rieske 2Fe-2S domain-containing protein [Thermoanaerobaculia bacterium]
MDELPTRDRRLQGRAYQTIAKQTWLSSVAEIVQPPVRRVAGESPAPIKNLLHGTTLGHPLHPALTDVPIGAWTASIVFDLADAVRGSRGARAAADLSLSVGLAGAAAAAVTGLADWSQTDGRARNVGVAHATCNTVAAILYGASLVLRMRGRRRSGRLTAAAGFGTVMLGGWLGGHLVFSERAGVDHSPAEGPEKYTDVLAASELPPDTPTRVDVKGTRVLLVRTGGKVYALAEQCPHFGGPLAEGRLEGASIRCPWHGSRFDLASGTAREGPTAFPARCFEVRTRAGRIQVRAARP